MMNLKKLLNEIRYGSRLYLAVEESSSGGVDVGTLYDFRNTGNHDIFYDAESDAVLSNTTAYSNDTGDSDEVVELSLSSVPSGGILVGSTVMKVGGTSFYTQGRVRATSFSWETYDSYGNVVEYTNFIHTDVFGIDGDSGGAAFMYYNGEYRIIGTMSGARYSGTETVIATYTYNALNSVIYRY